MVSDGDTIMIESGSCCALLADALVNQKKELTIITNSAFIADYIRGKSNFQIILLGGIYQQDAQVMVGPMIRQCAKNFFVDLFFIGTDGYTSAIGFTNRDQMRAQAVRDMSEQVEQVVVLTESDKFSKRGIVPLNINDKIKTVITDEQIPNTIKAELEYGIVITPKPYIRKRHSVKGIILAGSINGHIAKHKKISKPWNLWKFIISNHIS